MLTGTRRYESLNRFWIFNFYMQLDVLQCSKPSRASETSRGRFFGKGEKRKTHALRCSKIIYCGAEVLVDQEKDAKQKAEIRREAQDTANAAAPQVGSKYLQDVKTHLNFYSARVTTWTNR